MNEEKKTQALSIPPGASWQLMLAALLLLGAAFFYRMKRADS